MGSSVPDELLIGHRMYVDNEFNSRVIESNFSNAEWDLIMSVVSFRVDGPEDPESATLYPVTEGLPDAIAATDELHEIHTAPHPTPSDTAGGRIDVLVDRIKDVFGLDSYNRRSQDERLQAARSLVSEYAEVLEIHLRQQSQWADLCERAVEATD